MRHSRFAGAGSLVLLLLVMGSTPAWAQHVPFTRDFAAATITTLDVTTVRGKVDLVGSESGRVVVEGVATVRVGWNVPADAAEIAARVAQDPPVEMRGATLMLRPPRTDEERRAVTVSYVVHVPAGIQARVETESGAVTVSGLADPVDLRTGSGAIDLSRLGDRAQVSSQSGAVSVRSIAGGLSITTSSSAVSAHDVAGPLTVRTGSGSIDATLVGDAAVDVESGSSAIELAGVRGLLNAASRSGRISVAGSPSASWQLATGSGAVDVEVPVRSRYDLEASTRSGSIEVEGTSVSGVVEKRRVAGTVGGGGSLVTITSRSGSVRIHAGER